MGVPVLRTVTARSGYGIPVTVVIATRNRRDVLLRTLARLHRLPERPAVIVVDNASTDGTADAVRLLFPDVGVLGMSRDLGALARNVGVRAARTTYVAFSDDDSWWEPGALRRATEMFAGHPHLGLIAARTLVGAERAPDPINATMAATPLPAEANLPGPPVLGFLAGASLVRRRAFLEAGGFNQVLLFAGEERLLAYDLAALGWGRCYIPEVVALHEPPPNLPSSARRHRAELRNALLVAWLRRPAWFALKQTARLARRGLRDADSRVALAGAVRRMPSALLGRRRLPPSVEEAARLVEARS
ncbi:glycosyltransferase family 2 protein [Actinomadura sp. HBU206391]|uniref:glycosyltransferase family 2 protein n=1 Tax=Actinomadura sp. HBU206391 TaxID=2731692 RepID=UPI00164F2520|nr:glycosyltransferase [Actinomadura sp. HBU206391]MBC6459807.1 glycosyltransferase [Actinomadura sp. HBU206391]